MSRLYIAVVGSNRTAYNHPTTYENLVGIFGYFEYDNPPEPFEVFIRESIPPIGEWEVYEGVTYERNEKGFFHDVHRIRSMTDEEKQNKIDFMYAMFPLKGWNLDLNTKEWLAPTPYPDKDNNYVWNNQTTQWEKVDTWPEEWLRNPGHPIFLLIMREKFKLDLHAKKEVNDC